MLPTLVTTGEAARNAGVTEARIRRWAADGRLCRYGRIGGVAYYDMAEVLQLEAIMRMRRDETRLKRAMLDDQAFTGCTDPASV